ncbi:hypothetical protein PA598K_02962, partial [Paenibacillus sp. 598K]
QHRHRLGARRLLARLEAIVALAAHDAFLTERDDRIGCPVPADVPEAADQFILLYY